MRDPFEIILGPYKDHEILGRHLQGEEPNWSGLATDEKVDWLSSGEKIMLRVAAAFAGRDYTVLMADLGDVDATCRMRVAHAIIWTAREGGL